jgi:lipopolysaccharide export LptBFGC system permease protein LptF
VAFAFHTRWALAFSPLVLIVFAWSIVKATARSWTVGLAAAGPLSGYYMLLYGGRSLTLDGQVPALAAAWLPNAVLAAIAVALMILNRRLQSRRIPAAS